MTNNAGRKPMGNGTWTVAEAKLKFSEVIDEAAGTRPTDHHQERPHRRRRCVC
jgi:hypothetical protein